MVRLRVRPTTERKIYFYRVNTGYNKFGKPITFNLTPVLNHIESLTWTTRGRYLVGEEGRVTCCWVDRIGPPHKMRIGDIRRSELPQVEEAGILSPLGIPPQSGIAEQMHVILFENSIVGVDFNFYGPRIARLADYFIRKAQKFCPPILFFEPLLRQDVVEQLDRLKDVRLFNLKITSSYSEIITQANKDLGSAFAAAARAGEAEDLEIILRPTRYSKGLLSNHLLLSARRLVKRQDLHDGASRFIIKGFDEGTGRVEQLDLLNDKLIAKKRIIRLDKRTRALDPDSAYTAIQKSYEELYVQLMIAAGISL